MNNDDKIDWLFKEWIGNDLPRNKVRVVEEVQKYFKLNKDEVCLLYIKVRRSKPQLPILLGRSQYWAKDLLLETLFDNFGYIDNIDKSFGRDHERAKQLRRARYDLEASKTILSLRISRSCLITFHPELLHDLLGDQDKQEVKTNSIWEILRKAY